MLPAWVIVLLTFSFLVTIIAITLFAVIKVTKEDLSLPDRNILMAIDAQPDKVITAAELAKNLNITKPVANRRLRKLIYAKILRVFYDNRFTSHYTLAHPLEIKDLVPLSPEPYITFEDLLKLFASNEYRLTLQDIIMATGLPLPIIKKEMKKFISEGIIKRLTPSYDNTYNSMYILDNAYKGEIDNLLDYSEKLDLDLEKITAKLLNKMNY